MKIYISMYMVYSCYDDHKIERRFNHKVFDVYENAIDDQCEIKKQQKEAKQAYFSCDNKWEKIAKKYGRAKAFDFKRNKGIYAGGIEAHELNTE